MDPRRTSSRQNTPAHSQRSKIQISKPLAYYTGKAGLRKKLTASLNFLLLWEFPATCRAGNWRGFRRGGIGTKLFYMPCIVRRLIRKVTVELTSWAPTESTQGLTLVCFFNFQYMLSLPKEYFSVWWELFEKFEYTSTYASDLDGICSQQKVTQVVPTALEEQMLFWFVTFFYIKSFETLLLVMGKLYF